MAEETRQEADMFNLVRPGFWQKLRHSIRKRYDTLLGRPAPGMLPELREEMELIRRSGYFDAAWYRRYPKGALAADPLVHYVERGARKNLDPNPLFDSKMYRRAHGLGIEENPLVHFLKAGARATAGAYPSVEALRKIQADLRKGTSMSLVQDARREKRRFAVFLQCGASANHREWFHGEARSWDFVVNLFQDNSPVPDGADVLLRQTGVSSKTIGFGSLLEKFPQIAEAYDYWMLMDDDLLTTPKDIGVLFELLQDRGLDFAQPALSRDSFYSWPVVLADPRGGMRETNAVEWMVPILSRRLVECGRSLFMQNVSGWGVDNALGAITRSQLGTCPMVIDSIPFRHCRPVDLSGGGLYSFLQKAKVSPSVECRLTTSIYETESAIYELKPGEFVPLPTPAAVD